MQVKLFELITAFFTMMTSIFSMCSSDLPRPPVIQQDPPPRPPPPVTQNPPPPVTVIIAYERPYGGFGATATTPPKGVENSSGSFQSSAIQITDPVKLTEIILRNSELIDQYLSDWDAHAAWERSAHIADMQRVVDWAAFIEMQQNFIQQQSSSRLDRAMYHASQANNYKRKLNELQQSN